MAIYKRRWFGFFTSVELMTPVGRGEGSSSGREQTPSEACDKWKPRWHVLGGNACKRRQHTVTKQSREE